LDFIQKLTIFNSLKRTSRAHLLSWLLLCFTWWLKAREESQSSVVTSKKQGEEKPGQLLELDKSLDALFAETLVERRIYRDVGCCWELSKEPLHRCHAARVSVGQGNWKNFIFPNGFFDEATCSVPQRQAALWAANCFVCGLKAREESQSCVVPSSHGGAELERLLVRRDAGRTQDLP
jgi:hypothetical protein